MKKLFVKLFCFLPILAVVMFVNYQYDPAKVFHKGIVGEAINLIKKGYHVEGLVNYDERLFQEQFIKVQDHEPEVIALGSSRIMQLNKEEVGKDFLNHGMSGAGIYDFMGIMGIYEYQGMMPETVIIGADPWVLNENNGEIRYQTLEQYIRLFQGELDGKYYWDKISITLEEKKQLISLAYFQASVKEIGKQRPNGQQAQIQGTMFNKTDNSLRKIDGSTEYAKNLRERTLEQVNAEARTYISGEAIYQLQNYHELSVELKDSFELLIDLMIKNNIKVILYLPPYHPYVYEYIESDSRYQCVLEAEAYFRKYAMEHEMEIYGSYNPQYSGCENEDFLDGMHLKAGSVLKSFRLEI